MAGGSTKLRGNLSLWQVVGVSVALMAPSMAANINPQGAIGTVGRAIPLTFVIAFVAVLFIAYVFARLTQRFNHAGSVYGFVGATLGPRWGVVAGWSLIGTYVSYGLLTIMASGIFLTALLQALSIWHSPPDWAPFLLSAIEVAGVALLAARPARNATHVLLVTELTTVALIIVISVATLIELSVGHGPSGQHFTWSVFSVPSGVSVSALFLGVVFGFLSFAGFEASATLGEESKRPRRDIPRAIVGTAVFGGVYFIVVTAAEVMGFGTTPHDLARFAATGSLLGALGTTYLAAWLGNVVTLGTVISAFGCSLASTVGASRLTFSLWRDARGASGLGVASERSDAPVRATLAVVGAMLGITWLSAVAFGATAFDVFAWFGTIGTLIILVVYLLATVGAIRLLFFKEHTVAAWEIVLPVLAGVVIGYTLYRNVIPLPTGAALWFPIVAAAWIIVGVVGVIAARRSAERIGAAIARDEGLALPAAPAASSQGQPAPAD